MTDTTRLSTTLTKPQMTWLRAESKALGISIGELMRRILDHFRDSKQT